MTKKPRERRKSELYATNQGTERAKKINAGVASRLRTIRKLAYIPLNHSTPCPPRSAVSVNQGHGLAGILHPSTSSSHLIRVATIPAMSHQLFGPAVIPRPLEPDAVLFASEPPSLEWTLSILNYAGAALNTKARADREFAASGIASCDQQKSTERARKS